MSAVVVFVQLDCFRIQKKIRRSLLTAAKLRFENEQNRISSLHRTAQNEGSC